MRAERIRDWAASLAPGLVGGLAAVALLLLLRRAIEAPLFAEVVTDAAPAVLNPRGFATLLSEFGSDGKPLLFLSVLVLQALGFAVLGMLGLRAYARLRGVDDGDGPPRPVYGAALWSLVGLLVVLATALITAILTWTTPATLPVRVGWTEYVLTLVASSAAFALVMFVLVPAPGTSRQSGGPTLSRTTGGLSRRRFLRFSGGGVVALAAAALLGFDVWERRGGGAQRTVRQGPTPEITPNADFYVISKNLFDPRVPVDRWSLSVFGRVERDLLLNYDEVLARPSRQTTVTMQCISNEVGGDLISNAVWSGFPLRELLEEAGIQDSARFVAFRSWDGYTESLPLEFALRDSTMLVTQMNGEPLPDNHGFPLRLLAPGKYGIKHPKWITHIGLVETEVFGYWQLRGYTQDGTMKTSSRIDEPYAGQSVCSGRNGISGVAFAGDRGISRVEVSVDRGTTWRDARLREALSPFTWRLWDLEVDVPPSSAENGGRLSLLARATDGHGDLQPLTPRPPDPDGSQGWHAVSVPVVEARPGPETA